MEKCTKEEFGNIRRIARYFPSQIESKYLRDDGSRKKTHKFSHWDMPW